MLDEEHGERILNGSIDGMVSIIPQYSQYCAEDKKKVKEYHMTLFPTDRRIVVYQVGGFFKRDTYSQIPLSELDSVSVMRRRDKKSYVMVAEFIVPDDSKYPSLTFRMDCTGHDNDAEQFDIILRGIAKLAGIPLDDYTMR